jgi:hypothetical protein
MSSVSNVNMVLTSTRLKRAQYDPPYLSTNMQFHIHTPEGYNMIHPCSSTMHMVPHSHAWSGYNMIHLCSTHNMVLTSNNAWSGQQNDPPMPITMHMVLSHLHAWSGYDNDSTYVCLSIHMVLSTRLKRVRYDPPMFIHYAHGTTSHTPGTIWSNSMFIFNTHAHGTHIYAPEADMMIHLGSTQDAHGALIHTPGSGYKMSTYV